MVMDETTDKIAQKMYAANHGLSLDDLWYWNAPWFLSEKINWQAYAIRFYEIEDN
jgi:hypothetical protein